MSKIVELRQNRSFIDNKFEGYKLSLDAVPILRQELKSSPRKLEANADQYSQLHAELFSMQNLLQSDPWSRTSSYFIDRRNEVVRCNYDENVGRSEAIQTVYHLGTIDNQSGDYNCSLLFISEKYCVLCNGINTLLLLDTGDRRKAVEWKLVASTDISTAAPCTRGYLLYDARLDIIKEQKQISLVLGRVECIHDETSDCMRHYMVLQWVKWTQNNVDWVYNNLATLNGRGSIYHCAFEPRAESLILCSDREFSMKVLNKEDELSELHSGDDNKGANALVVQTAKSEEISVGPEVANKTADNLTDSAQNGNHDKQVETSENLYEKIAWLQAEGDVIVTLQMLPRSREDDYNVKFTDEKLDVACFGETLINHYLYDVIESSGSRYKFVHGFLEITLAKQNRNRFWASLLRDGLGPCEFQETNPVINLEAPIEDCDFPPGLEDREQQIERFHLPSNSVTHKVLLGTTPPLFSTNLRAGFPNAVATRQNVDACLWLQQYNPSNPNEWGLRHEGNLHAFGYVQASKQQKKFVDCSPDLNYAIICESHRHLYLYKAKYDTANGLRNRNGHQFTLGKQQLVTFGDELEILGMTTASSVITLLNEKNIMHVQI